MSDLVEQIEELLPQTQCTRCGYPACRPYAEAIAAGSADINQCPPGGEVTIRALAQLLGRAEKPLNPQNGAVRPRQSLSLMRHAASAAQNACPPVRSMPSLARSASCTPSWRSCAQVATFACRPALSTASSCDRPSTCMGMQFQGRRHSKNCSSKAVSFASAMKPNAGVDSASSRNISN